MSCNDNDTSQGSRDELLPLSAGMGTETAPAVIRIGAASSA
ncbi:MAG: hypothetical protein ACLQGP_15645 [Isosphaeraceae bacterium]